MNLGAAIRGLRIQKGLTQLYLAKETGLTNVGLSNIESGIYQPKAETITKIAWVLKVPRELIYIKAMDSIELPSHKQDRFRNLKEQMIELLSS